jgi:hypothetical protein
MFSARLLSLLLLALLPDRIIATCQQGSIGFCCPNLNDPNWFYYHDCYRCYPSAGCPSIHTCTDPVNECNGPTDGFCYGDSQIYPCPTPAPPPPPTNLPTGNPTRAPTTILPTRPPTQSPVTGGPTVSSTKSTLQPTRQPTTSPTTLIPSQTPSRQPTLMPSTAQPTLQPSQAPHLATLQPSQTASVQPTTSPISNNPTIAPTAAPVELITSAPTMIPTNVPTTVQCLVNTSMPDGLYSTYRCIPYDPIAPTSNFGNPTNVTGIASYTVETGTDGANFLVKVECNSSGTDLGSYNFFNIYIGGPNLSPGLVLEVTNSRMATTANTGIYYQLNASMGYTYDIQGDAKNGAITMRFQIPYTFFKSDPLAMNFSRLVGGDKVGVSYSQSIGYTFVGGTALFGVDRLGAQVIPLDPTVAPTTIPSTAPQMPQTVLPSLSQTTAPSRRPSAGPSTRPSTLPSTSPHTLSPSSRSPTGRPSLEPSARSTSWWERRRNDENTTIYDSISRSGKTSTQVVALVQFVTMIYITAIY